MLYNLFGTLNTVFIIVSVYGVYSQLQTIWQRKQPMQSTCSPTALLSLNQFSVSFLAYLSFFTYGYSIEPFNHYIVWPRLVASLLVLGILIEIWRDRKTPLALFSMGMASMCLVAALIGLCVGDTIADHGKYISTAIILFVSVLIAQGYARQISVIVHSGSTGAVDLKMSQFILMMDISTIAFALSMGLNQGWPLLVLALTSAITKLIIMYLFRWVKLSPIAKARRT